MVTYVLSRPITHNGQPLTEISMDLDGLSADDLEKCERIARKMLGKKEFMGIPETNKRYTSVVAAKASGIPIDVIRSMSAKDYTQVCLEVQNFLLDGDSEEEMETNTDEFIAGQKKEELGETPTLTMTTTVKEEVSPHTSMGLPGGYEHSANQ